MRHVSAISRTPAQAGICDSLNSSNDFQVALCFAYEIISEVMLPIIEIFLGDKFAAPAADA